MARTSHWITTAMKILIQKKFRLFNNLLMALALIFLFAEASAKEKMTCDPIDAPNVDPAPIIRSIEQRISALDELQAGLRKTREELKSASTIEQWSIAGVFLAQTVKSTSAIALTASGALATAPEALAVSIVSSTTNLVIDTINNSHENQDKILFDTLKSYGASNTEMLGSNLLKAFGKPGMAGAWSTIFGLGSFVKETFDLVNLAEIYGSANMHTQINGINKQIAKYENDISILKEELNRTKRRVSETTKKINAGFIDIINKHNKSNVPMCKKKVDKVTLESLEQIRQKIKAAAKPAVLPTPDMPLSSGLSIDPYQGCYLRKASCEQSCDGNRCLQQCEDEWYDCRYGSE